MSEDSNKNINKPDLNKVEEPVIAYNSESITNTDFELNKVLNQILEIGLKQIELDETKPHEEFMAEMKLKYNFK